MANQNFKVKKGLEVGTALTATSDGLNVTGIITATQFNGDGSGLTGVVAAGSGVVIQEEGSSVGTAATINFVGTGVTATVSDGVATIDVTSGSSSGITTANVATDTLVVSGVSTFTDSVTFQSHASFGDSDKAIFGDGQDLQIYHTGSDSVIADTGIGNLNILGDADVAIINAASTEYKARFITDGAAELYYNGTKKFETTGVGVTILGRTQTQELSVSGIATFTAGLTVPSTNAITIGGGGSKLTLASNGSGSQTDIRNTGSGTIRYRADQHDFMNSAATGTPFSVNSDSSVTLSHSNIPVLKTVGAGVTIGTNGYPATLFTNQFSVSGFSTFQGNARFNDNYILYFGDGNDLEIKSDGANGYIRQNTSSLSLYSDELYLRNNTNNEPYLKGVVNGSVELYYDNSKKFETTGVGASCVGIMSATNFVGDGSGLTSLTGASAGTFGASNATPIITVDSNGRITGIATVATAGAGGGGGISNVVEDTTPQLGGNLDLNSKDITGSGDLDYTGNLKVTGISTITGVAGFSSHVTLPDHAEIQVGSATGGDLKIYHDGSNSYVSDAGTGGLKITGGDVYIRNVSDQDMIHASSGSFVKLYHNNALRLQTTGTGVNITDDLNVAGISTFNNDVRLLDGDNLYFGTDSDTSIVHSGTNTIMNVDGNYFFQGNTFYVQNQAGSKNYIRAYPSTTGAVELYHDNSKKLETTSSGVTVTGTVAATSFTGDGSSLTGIAVTSQSNTQVTYNFGASGNNYVITGPGYSNTVNNPDLYLVRGQRYRFINATGSSHPLRIQSDTSGTAYTDGVSGSQSGTQEFNVQHDAPSRLFYQCTIHSGMIGNIYITGGGQWENTSVAASGTPEIYTDYNVGIGTDNPRSKLDIQGSDAELRFYRDQGDRFGGLRYTGSLFKLRIPAADHFVIDDASNNETLRITSAGLVGIGTDNPSAKLHISNGNANDHSDGILLSKQGGNIYGIYPSTNNLEFKSVTGNTHIATFDYSGNIGIGTASPHAKLEVSGGQNQTANQFTDLVSVAANAGNDSINAEVQLNFGISPSHTAEANRKARIQSVTHGGTARPLLINPAGGSVGIGTDTPGAILEVFDATSNTILNVKSGDAGAVLNLIDNSARSSIEQNGTTLKISSDTDAADADSDIRLQVDGASKMIIRDSGDVITGVPADDNRNNNSSRTAFTVADTTNGALLQIRGGSPAVFFDQSGGNIGQIFLDGVDFAIQSGTPASAGTERLRILSDGNIGIGDNAPSQKLNVAGNIMLEGSDQYMYLTNVGTGNAGIYVRGRDATSELRSHSTGIFTWEVTGNEKMRLTSTGEVKIPDNGKFVAGASDDLQIYHDATNSYIKSNTNELKIAGKTRIVNNSNTESIALFNPDGAVELYYDNVKRFETQSTGFKLTGRMYINGSAGAIDYNNTAHTLEYIVNGSAHSELNVSAYVPATDVGRNLGSSSKRWSTIYAFNSSINTSDRNEKQQIRDLSTAELTVAQGIKGLIKAYKFNSSVTEKGDEARIHVGVIAQDVATLFSDNGLDAADYGLWCSDTWYELDGNEVTSDTEGAVEKTRMGVRYNELLAFVIAAL